MREPDLQVLLQNVLDAPAGSSPLEELLLWLKEADPEGGEHSLRTARLRRLKSAVVAHPRCDDLRRRIAETWRHASALRLLAESGLPARTSFMEEGFRKLVDGFVPRKDAEDDLHALLGRLHLEKADAAWIQELSPEDLEFWGPLLDPGAEIFGQAAVLLAHRAAAVGLSRDVLDLDPEPDIHSPFMTLSQKVQAWGEAPGNLELQSQWDEARASCRAHLRAALEHLDDRGVSTDLVYRLELLDAQLIRIDALLHSAAGLEDRRRFAAQIVRGAARERSLRAHFRRSLKRLSRKVVEHTGETGEHYIVRNRKEWNLIGRAAAGAGLLTVLTAAGKYALAALPLSPLIEGLGLAANYAISFILMQFLGLTLASKQPSMTASALAAGLEREDGMEEEVELVAAITRSQTIATLGNVLAAIPGSLVLCWLWTRLLGHPLLSPETASHGLASLHPWLSLTAVYAIFTGVCLWAQSLAAGWAGNWAAYRRLPEAIAASPRIRRAFGLKGAAAMARATRKHLSGVVGYLTLGFLLGFVPVLVSKFIGIHLEVRHVTLQAASWALDLGSLWHTPDWQWSLALWGLPSLALIGFLNFSVSFWLALRTAMRARDLDPKGRRELRRRILSALNRQPSRFLWAPRPASSAKL